jgi:3'(2'), 5'-bisphosphate nucleotidase
MNGIGISTKLETAIKASLEAGKAIMDVYNTTIEVEYKNDKSPLTEADKKANEVINFHLKKTETPIISEENKQIDFDVRKKWNLCWIVDPVDGTKEFIKRNGEFTVNIALIENGIPKLGVIYVPEKKVLYFGNTQEKKAYKAHLKEHEDSLQDIISNSVQLNPKFNSSGAVRIVGSRSHMNDETTQFVEELKQKYSNVEIVSKGSSLKFCLVAEGIADIYPRFAPTMEWDTAAGQAICEAIGVKVIDQETQRPLRYNKKNLLNPWFMVTHNEG